MRVSTKGQVTIPYQMRTKLGMLPCTEVDFILQDDGILEIHRRLSLSIGGSLEAEDARMIDVKRILTFEQSLLSLANAISDRYFSDPKSAVKEERSGLA